MAYNNKLQRINGKKPSLRQKPTEKCVRNFLTSRTVSAGKLLISSDSCVRVLDARISFVKSTCSHHRSSVLFNDIFFASSGTSILILHTELGTENKNITHNNFFKCHNEILSTKPVLDSQNCPEQQYSSRISFQQ